MQLDESATRKLAAVANSLPGDLDPKNPLESFIRRIAQEEVAKISKTPGGSGTAG
jgi:hypothetical protein